MVKIRECTKRNAVAVKTLFRLRFEVLWAAPYDIRRSYPEFCEFERRISRVVALLCAAETSVDGRAVQEALADLRSSIDDLRHAQLFLPEMCDEAERSVKQLAAEVETTGK